MQNMHCDLKKHAQVNTPAGDGEGGTGGHSNNVRRHGAETLLGTNGFAGTTSIERLP